MSEGWPTPAATGGAGDAPGGAATGSGDGWPVPTAASGRGDAAGATGAAGASGAAGSPRGSAPATTAPELPPGARCAVHEEADAVFVCGRCGTFGCLACVFAGTDRGTAICRACAARGLPEPIPWERRRELGWIRAFWQTTKLVSAQPTRFFATPTTESGLLGPMLYAVLAYTVGLALQLLSMGLAMVVTGGGLALFGEPTGGAVLATYGLCFGVGMLPFTLASYPVYAILGALTAGGLGHGTLVLFKARTASFEQSLRAVCFANAPYFWTWVPCVGWFLSWPWVWAAEVIALRETHRTGTDKAAFAALGHRLLFTLLVIGVYAGLVALMVFLERGRAR